MEILDKKGSWPSAWLQPLVARSELASKVPINHPSIRAEVSNLRKGNPVKKRWIDEPGLQWVN
jgi:hypothetical protein